MRNKSSWHFRCQFLIITFWSLFCSYRISCLSSSLVVLFETPFWREKEEKEFCLFSNRIGFNRLEFRPIPLNSNRLKPRIADSIRNSFLSSKRFFIFQKHNGSCKVKHSYLGDDILELNCTSHMMCIFWKLMAVGCWELFWQNNHGFLLHKFSKKHANEYKWIFEKIFFWGVCPFLVKIFLCYKQNTLENLPFQPYYSIPHAISFQKMHIICAAIHDQKIVS